MKTCKQDARRHKEGKHAPHNQGICNMQRKKEKLNVSTQKNTIRHWGRKFSQTPTTPTGEKIDTGGTRRQNNETKKRTRRERISKIDLAKRQVSAFQEMAKKHHIAASGKFFHRNFAKRMS
jgi:hypothetical protein